MSPSHPDPANRLLHLMQDVQKSTKYAAITPQLIEAVGARELAKGRSYKDALKATKNKLHQIAGVYLTQRPAYDLWLEQLRQAESDSEQMQQTCRAIMTAHASTRERLPILDTFYATLFRDLPPIHSLQDLACGLNPLTLPWMKQSGALAADFSYWAYDVYTDLADFLQALFVISSIPGHAVALDLLREVPTQKSDVALLFKAAPCLEQVDKQAGRRLLERVEAKVVFISFPVQSLGGRNRGMVQNYTAHFHQMVHNSAWRIDPFEFETELVFRVCK